MYHRLGLAKFILSGDTLGKRISRHDAGREKNGPGCDLEKYSSRKRHLLPPSFTW
jgi:hypothetical protein